MEEGHDVMAYEKHAADDLILRDHLAIDRTKLANERSVETLLGFVDHQTIGITALYGLGTVARHLRESGKSDRSDAISEMLLKRLKRAKSSSERVHVLRAIANAGYISSVNDIVPFLSSEDASVRGAAVQSLRLMKHPRVDLLIAHQLEKENSRRARLDALSAAKVRKPSKVLSDAVIHVATTAADSQSRMKAVQLMINWMVALPDLRTTLAHIAEADENLTIQGAAEAAVR